jgi:putative ABC transport system substrate-binding protein
MRRREFITLVCGGMLAAPLAARAQRVPVIGFVSTRSRDESGYLLAAFRRGLAQTGAIEGQNVTVEYRWADGQYERVPELAAELVRRPIAVLVAAGGQPAALAAKAATRTIPIVANFSADPVAAGLVASINKPGGNITGISNPAATLEPKRFGLLHELVPQAAALGVLLNPQFPLAPEQLRDTLDAARAAGVQLHVLRASTDREIEAAFETVARQHIPALVVAADPFFSSRRDKLVDLAAHSAVPVMYPFREFPVTGGLMSYGIDLAEVYRRNGVYTGFILKGAKPADLPVLLSTRFEFVINLKTAKALGVTFSDNLLSLADEVIE